MRDGGKVVTRTMLLERVWNYHFDPQTNIVETHISRMRAKLNEGGLPDLIETVAGLAIECAAMRSWRSSAAYRIGTSPGQPPSRSAWRRLASSSISRWISRSPASSTRP